MITYRAADLHVCLLDRRAIFLDLRADRYFCLSGPLDAAFRERLRDPKGSHRREEGTKSVGECLINLAARHGFQQLECPILTRDIDAESLPRPRMTEVIATLAAQYRAGVELGFRRLRSILSRLTILKATRTERLHS